MNILLQGSRFKKALKVRNKKQGFFDWQYTEDDDKVIFEFYWDNITEEYIYYLYSFIKSNEKYKPVLTGGSHHDSEKKQIMLKLTVEKES